MYWVFSFYIQNIEQFFFLIYFLFLVYSLWLSVFSFQFKKFLVLSFRFVKN